MRFNRLLSLATTTSLIIVLTATSCGKKDSEGSKAAPVGKTDAAVSKDLFGTWGTLVFPAKDDDSGMEIGEIKINLKIADGTLTLSNYCYLDLVDLGPVEVTVPANITTSSIVVLAGNSDTKHWEDGTAKATCSASVKADTLNYVLNGDTLTLVPSGSQSKSFTLNRIKQ